MTAGQAPAPSGAVPLEEQAATCKAWAEYYRGQVKIVFEEARRAGQPDAWRQALEQIRGFQDALEEYVALAVAQKGATARLAADAKTEYDEKWAGIADGDLHTGVRRGEDFEGPRERYARRDVKVFTQLRAWRQAEKMASLFAEVHDDVWLRYRAINAVREDIAAIMRGYAFESSLER